MARLWKEVSFLLNAVMAPLTFEQTTNTSAPLATVMWMRSKGMYALYFEC